MTMEDCALPTTPDLKIAQSEYVARRARLAAAARAQGLDGVVVWSREGTAADRVGYAVLLYPRPD